MSDCLFCKIIAGEIPSDFIFEDENVVAFRDINPLAPTHVLIVPKEHIVTFADVEARHADTLVSIATAVREVAKGDGVLDSGYRLLNNNGSDANQEVPHLHIHLVGGRNVGPMIKRAKTEG